MRANHVLGIVGPVRSGKTAACDYLRKNYNATIFRNSEVLEQIAQNLHMDMNRANLAQVGMALYDVFGRGLLAKHWIEKIKNVNSNTNLIVIDGLRFPEEVVLYRQQSNFTLAAIIAPDQLRHGRSKMALDNFKDGTLDAEAFLKQSRSTNESYVDQLVKDSDTVINNDATINGFHQKIDKIIEALI